MMQWRVRRASDGCLPALAGVFISLSAGQVAAYPLDGGDESGIRRLEGYRIAQSLPSGAKLTPGALLDSEQIELRLGDPGIEDFDAVPEDPELADMLRRLFAGRDRHSGGRRRGA